VKAPTERLKFRTAATLTIKDAGTLTPQQRRPIAAWLRRQAQEFLHGGNTYTDKTFHARYQHKAGVGQ
jgi:hypothetical protein